MPQHLNSLGHVFGGAILAMVDRAAAVAAIRHAGTACVTVSIDRVDFREPIYAGELVTCAAQVNYVGQTSIEVGVLSSSALGEVRYGMPAPPASQCRSTASTFANRSTRASW